MRIVPLSKMELLQAELGRMRTHVVLWLCFECKVLSFFHQDVAFGTCFGNPCEAADCNISVEDVALLGWCDLNVPFARGKQSVVNLCKGMAMINETSPTKSASVLVMPDFPCDSSPRGLWDEERRVFEELFALNQAVETRWVEMFARADRRADLKSNARRFGSGRLVCSAANQDENMWLSGELAVYGRPIGSNESTQGAPTAVLPRTAQILIPEAASPAT